MSAGMTNAVASGGGLKVIASGSQSLVNSVNVTLPQPASFLLFQEWRIRGSDDRTMQSSGMLVPGDTVIDPDGASTTTLVSFTGTEFYYTKDMYGADEYTLKYIALG